MASPRRLVDDGCELCGHQVAADLTAEFSAPDPGVAPEPWVHCIDEGACTRRVVVAKQHPSLECGTCRAAVMLVDRQDVPDGNDCLDLIQVPNRCNTWAMRVAAGLAPRRALRR